jgi:hypothetical protein
MANRFFITTRVAVKGEKLLSGLVAGSIMRTTNTGHRQKNKIGGAKELMCNRVGKYSALVNAGAVIGFALSLLTGFLFGSYLTSMFIAYSFIPLICAFAEAGRPDMKSAGKVAMIFAGMYGTFIVMVYFTQLTTLRNEALNEQAVALLDYTTFGWFFNLNLLGYGFMSLSTFFIGMTIDVKSKADKTLKYLLMIHGIFFISCLIMPITGVFTNMDDADIVGTFVLLFWCAIFLPISILSFDHFKKNAKLRL